MKKATVFLLYMTIITGISIALSLFITALLIQANLI